ncbi:phospho-sugar mutase [Psychromicrobium xiongbiense]|uniref:phospho-sugar mutase n=1 Tax=Psychromicrobium xiongbiense TaxID=3051184 RepID=UPI00255645F5|nr:phospho-sugar mutase [Psychromicrobium sp. YIM S02556]
MSSLDPLTLERAQAWAAADPDPATAAELAGLLEAAALPDTPEDRELIERARQEVQDAFAGSLQFGTAGLRAALGPGPNRMNRVVVRRAAAGFARFLHQSIAQHSSSQALSSQAGDARARIVVGYDARHNSEAFARESAAIFVASGLETFLMPSALPTPLLAFAVRALGCDGGVMVTASHNPAQDNGYKVYLGGRALGENDQSGRGAQIVPPYDAQIAALIDAVGPVNTIPLATEGWNPVPAEVIAAYRTGLVELLEAERFPHRDLKIVLTAMHGVGGATAEAVLRAGGFDSVSQVAAQELPDPNFPTVIFPNPEEPGALDLALDQAQVEGADLVIANDPDADRLAIAAQDPVTAQWRMLRGDEVGALLGSHLADRLAPEVEEPAEASPAPIDAATGHGVFANSIVSSRLLGKIAAAEGFRHEQTLTGFKWIARVPGLSFGYEEALGYCVAPALVRDKDGISAALLLAELAAALKAEGKTLFDRLDELAVVHGLHVTDQLSIRVADIELLQAMMDRVRDHPPVSLAGSPVDTVQDLSLGSHGLPPTDGMLYINREDVRVIVRPSGTEPKLKCYLEAIVPVDSAAALPEARRKARTVLNAVLADVREALGL